MNYALIVQPDDAETKPEDLKVHVLVKPAGYLRETLESAKRLPDRHVARGQAYLIIAGQVTL